VSRTYTCPPGHSGERRYADALVMATDRRSQRWIVMVERADGAGWALPGGYVDPGETAADAAVRGLAEATGLVLPAAVWQVSPARSVPDPRASDEPWLVATVARTALDLPGFPPRLTAGGGVRGATWIRADSYELMTAWLRHVRWGAVFPAHRALLADELAEVAR
jgi:ADP-ribose pyrophosphatase